MSTYRSKDEIFSSLIGCAREVLPDLKDHTFRRSDQFPNLGANSVHRAEIMMMVIEDLSLGVCLPEMFGPSNLGELVDLLHKKSNHA